MEQGFFKSLFDFSFSSFVTPRLVRVLYAISLVVIVLIYLGIALALFGANSGSGLAWLVIGGPIAALLYAIFYRVLFELIVVVFRIYETVRDDLALQRQLHPEAAAAVAAAAGNPVAAAPAYQSPTRPPGPPAPPAAPSPPSPPGGTTPYTPPSPRTPPSPPNPGA